jgi:Flp pilus assembly protein TadG
MALVALAIFGIIAMAALSIDIGTLYQASAEAQRSADAAALAGARVLSLSGMTGDPTNSSGQWLSACNAAALAVQAVASQNTVAGRAPVVSLPTPTFSATDGSGCTSVGSYAFGVNPMVTVKVTQSNLPTYFSRIWGSAGSSVSATATAEVFNPSNSGSFAGGQMVPVQPRCVKPWIVPNKDPLHPAPSPYCTAGCSPFVGTSSNPFPNGTIVNGGILTNGSTTGVIGESFNLIADCNLAGTGNCNPPLNTPPGANAVSVPVQPNLQYLPGQVLGSPAAVQGCATDTYQKAIAGCDQSTAYRCGVQAMIADPANYVDLTENPNGVGGDTATAAACLIHESDGVGEDTLNLSASPAYPYQIDMGANNPLAGGSGSVIAIGSVITSSDSIMTLPIYDDTQPLMINGSNPVPVTIVGFLQVFIQDVSTADGSLAVTVMNVAACGNAVANGTVPLYGTSPVPVRLITPP